MWAIALMVLCTVFTSSAQILYKIGSNKLNYNFISIITNWHIILGLILYGIGAVLVIIALKGGEVSVLYPIITSSYIWVTLGSNYFFNETLNTFKVTGIIFIMAGIFLIAREGKEKTLNYTGDT